MKLLTALCTVSIILSAWFAVRIFMPLEDVTVQTTQITVTYWRDGTMVTKRLSVRGLETSYWPEGP